MQNTRRTLLLLLALSFAATALPSAAQSVIATIPVGTHPYAVALNTVTNKAYIANYNGNSVTVIDGTTLSTATVPVGPYPEALAVNPVTKKIYVADSGDQWVWVIDGATLTTTLVSVGASGSVAVVVDSETNKIFVANYNHANVTVIDGATLSTTTVPVGIRPSVMARNPVTNKIYVGSAYEGGTTVTVIDEATLYTVPVTVGNTPSALAINTVTNKIFVANFYGNSVTVIDGPTNNTNTVGVRTHPDGVAVDSVTNKIYVADQGDNTVTVIDGATLQISSVPAGREPYAAAMDEARNRAYIANYNGASVTVINGADLSTVTVNVGRDPRDMAFNPVTNRIYVVNYYDSTVSVIAGPEPLQFVAVTPCRLVDTRQTGGPIQGGNTRTFPVPQEGGCNIPDTAAAYSLNVTVVPHGPLGYLTIWPTGEYQPLVSTMNSLDGRVKADAAIVPAGSSGEVSVYVTNTTDVILDIDGYFAPVSGSTYAFYPLPPCRVADTRKSDFPQGLGPPQLFALTPRDFPVLNSPCIPSGINPAAYSFNFTVVPGGHPVGYLSAWPTGQSQPVVSTLNDQTGTIVANAAIVPAGTGGDISVYSTNDTQLLIDINGYFAPAGPGGLSLFAVTPCRVIDTRHRGSGQPFSGTLSPPVDVVDSPCGPPANSRAYVFNATVVPTGGLGYLTLWPDGTDQPVVSTLNAFDGALTNNMAIVPSTNGKVDAYANGITQLILDISSYFAP
jgi:YVTN family beta-propeller protein